MHEEIAAVYKGSNDEETFTAAFMFMEYYLDFLFKGCRSRSFQLEDSAEEWILRDLDIENRWLNRCFHLRLTFRLAVLLKKGELK